MKSGAPRMRMRKKATLKQFSLSMQKQENMKDEFDRKECRMNMCGKENCHDKCLMSVRALCKEKQIFLAKNHQHHRVCMWL